MAASDGGAADSSPDLAPQSPLSTGGSTDASFPVTGQDHPTRIVVDSTNVYWLSAGTPDTTGTSNTGKVMQCAAAACIATQQTLASSQTNVSEIAVDATHVYWTTRYAVTSVPMGGTTVTTLASGQNGAYGLAVDANNVYWTTSTDVRMVAKGRRRHTDDARVRARALPSRVTTDGTNVYWTNSAAPQANAGSVMKCSVGGCSSTPTTLASGQNQPTWGIAVDGTNVYWIDSGPNVMKVSIAGGSPVTLASTALLPADLAIDTTYVYWTDSSAGTVMKVPIAGGSPTTVFTLVAPEGLAGGLRRTRHFTDISKGWVARIVK